MYGMNEVLVWLFAVITFVYGTVFASFFTLVGYRVPINMSIVKPPSHCMECKKRLKWIDLIPIVSYLFNRGRCRYCKTSYGSFHVWLEVFIGILFSYGFISYVDKLSSYGIFLGILVIWNMNFVAVHVHNEWLKKTTLVMLSILLVVIVVFWEIFFIWYIGLMVMILLLDKIKEKRKRYVLMGIMISLLLGGCIESFIMNLFNYIVD